MRSTYEMRTARDSAHQHLVSRKAPRLPLVDHKGRLNVETRGAPKHSLYWGDLFHTLVNMPSPRFMLVLFCTYSLLFGGFAIPYYYDAYNNFCIPGVLHYSHALWFSVQTSMTIGYGGELTPDPKCMMTNIVVVVQSLVSLLVAYSLLGVFYIRFARPARRAQTLIFSKRMVIYEEDGVRVLAFRMANVRKHQIIEANVRLLIGLNNHLTDEDESVFHFTPLKIVGGSEVFLGLPYIVKHPITSTSPLYGLTVQGMEQADAEILVLLEGVDASTSSKLQARRSYLPSDIISEHRFETAVSRTRGGQRSVDFTKFDSVIPVTANVSTRPGASIPPSPAISALQLPGLGPMNSSFQSNFDFLDRDDASFVQSIPVSPDSPADSEKRDKLSGLNIDIPKRSFIHPHRQSIVRSMPDLLYTEVLNDEHEPSIAAHEDLKHRVLIAEARALAWKQMVIELASGIQQTLQQPSLAANADSGNLVATARQALSVALTTN
ncbi:unnamed protein product [Calypogeia fissa]